MESGTTPVRELSPESRIFVAPSLPKGTRSRPAKNSSVTKSGPPSSGDIPPAAIISTESSPDAHTLALYIEHVEWLDPKDDEKPLREFTKRWLGKPSSEWPISADRRVYMFMHKYHFYNPIGQDYKELELINFLRHDTEIEIIQPLEYTTLKSRALDRVRFLADELQRKHFVTRHQNGNLDMVKGFKDVWKYRQEYWDKRGTLGTFMTQERYESLNLYDDDEDDCVPVALKKKAASKAKQPIVLFKATTSKSSQRRKADESVAEVTQGRNLSGCSSPIQYPNKRQRPKPSKFISPEDGIQRRPTEIRSDQSQVTELSKKLSPKDTIQRSTDITSDNRLGTEELVAGDNGFGDSEAEKQTRFAELVLMSPALTERQSTPPRRAIAPPPSFTEQARDCPMTPISPAVVPGDHESTIDQFSTLSSAKSLITKTKTFDTRDSISPPNFFKSPTMRSVAFTEENQTPNPPSLSSNSSKSNTPAPTLRVSQHVLNPSTAPRRSSLEISLTIQKKNRTYDLQKLDFSYLRVLDLTAFFAFVSQRSGVPLLELDCLTFRIMFGSHLQQLELIRKSSTGEEWMDLKANIKRFYKFSRMKYPRDVDYDIWIEIGDTREVDGAREENMGES